MTAADREGLWLLYHRFYKSRVIKYSPKINKELKKQVDQFISVVKSGQPEVKALDSISPYGLYEVLKNLYYDAGIVYGAKILTYIRRQKARMPIGFNELMTKLINEYFATELLNDVNNITQTTKDLIRDIFIDSYAKGDSFDDIEKLLSDIGFTLSRSRLIARTETSTAANTGANLSAKATGLKMNKVWIAATDNRTRRIPRDAFDHLHMDGVTIPAEELFLVNGVKGNELMDFPGDRKHGADAGNLCNCRCTHGYIPVRDKVGLVQR